MMATISKCNTNAYFIGTSFDAKDILPIILSIREINVMDLLGFHQYQLNIYIL